MPTSPATDAAASCTTTVDQRGIFRPQDGNATPGALCDLGAYEIGTQSIIQFSSPTYNVDESAGPATITVTRTGSGGVVSATVTLTNGTATAPADYDNTSIVVTFLNGETSKDIAVPIVNDLMDEPNETVNLALGSPSTGAAIGAPGAAILTILDDDAPPTISVDDIAVAEGNSGTTSFVFTVTLSAPSGNTVTVQVQTADGTAQAGSDYTAIPLTTLTFIPGETSKTVTVLVNGDTQVEPNENYALNLSNAANASIADAQGVGTILNDDGSPTLSIDDVTVLEKNVGTETAVFTVTLSPPSSQTVTVVAQSADNTASIAGGDYLGTGPVTLTFSPGATSQVIPVTVLSDTVLEPNETFFVNLSSPTNATIADDRGIGTIVDDDGPPSLSIDDVVVHEGDSGTTNAVFTVTLSLASAQPVTVVAQTANGTALAGSDYTAVGPITVTFPPGTTSQTVTVPVRGDTVNEPYETFFVNLSSPTNATIADAQGLGTIVNDDGLPGLSINVNDASVLEGNNGTTNAVFAVTLSAASDQTVTVVVQTADGTALAGSDYVATGPLTLTFAPGVTEQRVNVPVIGDTVVEPDETFSLNLSRPVNAALANREGRGLIRNDDTTSTPKQEETDDEDERNPPEPSEDDLRTEGNVVEIRADQDPPVVVIANRDGLVELRLYGDARNVLSSLRVGQYVVGTGQKEHEQLYLIDDLSIE